MRSQMIKRRSFFAAVAGVFFVLGVSAAEPVKADGAFTSASIQGSYAYINDSGGVGSFGPMVFDGEGGLNVTLKINLPCEEPVAMCPRTIVDTSGTGTYTVEPDGTGVATIDLDVGTTRYDFVISKAKRNPGKLIATEVFAVGQIGGLAGQLIAPTWNRVSD